MSAMQKAEADRTSLNARITQIETKINSNATTALTKTTVDLYIEKAYKLEEDLIEVHRRIMYLGPTPAEATTHENTFITMTDEITTLIIKLMDIKKAFPSTASTNPPPSSSRQTLKLPRMELPTFEGKYEDWQSFSDLFSATVDRNASLSGAEKLQYLRSCVKGDAQNLIKSFPITDSHYGEAWTLLKDRYNNQREIIHSLCKKLLFQSNIKNECASSIQTLLNTSNECIRSLRVQGREVDKWDDLIVVAITEKLDPSTRAEWSKTLKGVNPPTYKELQEFLEQHIRSLHARGTGQHKATNATSASRSHLSTHHSSCIKCGEDHQLYHCDKFKGMSTSDRANFINKSPVCRNCFRQGHNAKDCQSKSNCRKCHQRHNTLLHFDRKPQQASSSTEATASSNNREVKTVSSSHATNEYNAQVLLKTAIVNVSDNNGQNHKFRVLYDDGSESTFITYKCVAALGLKKYRAHINVTGISAASVTTVKSKVSVRLSSLTQEASLTIEALVLPKVTGTLPRFTCDPTQWPHLTGLQLADPHFNIPGDIDILLGADVLAHVMKEGIRHGPKLSPTAQNSIFGWVLYGKVSLLQPKIVRSNNASIQDILHKFWEMEELPPQKHLTKEEKECEQHFSSTHQRNDNGRYVVKLPFNDKKNLLGNSRQQAMSRLLQLERRFQKYPQHKEAYVNFMREYLSLGHMKNVDNPDPNVKAFYLPHHFVLKEDSSTTKLRVVFDGSAKTDTGISLNDALMCGPTIQPDMFQVIMKMRYHKIILKADITKMYRMFEVDKEDSNYQRILWRESPEDSVHEYNLSTVTYGTKSASYQATRCLQQLAEDESNDLPRAAQVLKEETYVDDIVTGAPCTSSAIQLYHDVTEIIRRGGMGLKKWATNDPRVFDCIPIENRETDVSFNFDNDKNIIKALGVRWNFLTDNFMFAVSVSERETITKRELLSDLAKVFDPMGWLSPVTVSAKLIFQQLWKENCDWDETISGQLHEKWATYQEQLASLSSIKIPRCIVSATAISYQLHGFSDASEKAYAAAVYLRCESADNFISTNLIAAKSKVAPVKQKSLPRLELCGALLLAELLETVKGSVNFECDIYGWTDSTIVLNWLSSYPSRWQTFVGNRVAKIQDILQGENWHHVRSEHNPADHPSRGITPAELVESTLWWHGPEWLKDNSFPNQTAEVDMDQVTKEERCGEVFVSHASIVNDIFSKYSSLIKLKRAVVYFRRFFQYIKNKGDQQNDRLSSCEVVSAMNSLIRLVQSSEFPAEVTKLKNGQAVHVDSRLKQLYPYIDENGIIRVGGRLENASVASSRKHPIILPHKHPLTQLIVTECHEDNHHSGCTLTLSTLQQRYWILRGRDVVRHFIRKCVICRRNRAALSEQLMSSLPKPRVTSSRPFQHCGVDFAGPYSIRMRRGRGQKPVKCYFCVFVCFATKALHLETCMDLSSDGFIACYKRFVSRRGLPTDLYSDCGTNFVGAEKELRCMFQIVQGTSVNNELTKKGTTWHFNPPSAPHYGGLWEAGVKSVKHHLRRVLGANTPTLEQFQTLLCTIEGCLNSRPLCALSSDPTDMEALTPGHFLIGQPITAVPEPDITKLNTNRLSYWQEVQQLTQRFWKRWHTEYLSSLQQRFKWTTKRANLEVNDLVVIKDDHLPPTKWKLGRIIEVHPREEGCVGTVTLRVKMGNTKDFTTTTITRPIAKLSPILFNSENTSTGNE